MYKVCVIGATCIDVIIDHNESTIINNKDYVNDISIHIGGDAFNEAKILSKLNVDTELISLIGNDASGKLILNELKVNNVHINLDCTKDDIKTSNVVIDNKQGKSHYISTLDGSVRQLSLDNIIEPRIDTKLVSFASLFISNKLDNTALNALFTKYKKQGIIICADMTMPKNNETYLVYKESLSHLDYFFPNKNEAFKFCECSDIKLVANKLYEIGVKNVIIKCGKDGVYLKNEYYDQIIECELINDEVVDETGSGDSFVAGFIAKIIKDRDIIKAIKFGMTCGYKATKFIGSTTWLDYE